MLKHLKIYEIFKKRENWEIGDIVVAMYDLYSDNGYWLHKGNKYEIVEFIPEQSWESSTIQVKDIKKNKILYRFFRTNNFITLEEWNLNQSLNKYNL